MTLLIAVLIIGGLKLPVWWFAVASVLWVVGAIARQYLIYSAVQHEMERQMERFTARHLKFMRELSAEVVRGFDKDVDGP